MKESFTRTALLVTAGLLIWAANFLLTYTFAAVACARGFATSSVAGVNVVRGTVLAVTLASLAAIAAVGWHVRRLREVHDARSAEDSSRRLVVFITLAGCALATVAIVWNGFAAFLKPQCGS